MIMKIKQLIDFSSTFKLFANLTEFTFLSDSPKHNRYPLFEKIETPNLLNYNLFFTDRLFTSLSKIKSSGNPSDD
jgi:hypothetical protein